MVRYRQYFRKKQPCQMTAAANGQLQFIYNIN